MRRPITVLILALLLPPAACVGADPNLVGETDRALDGGDAAPPPETAETDSGAEDSGLEASVDASPDAQTSVDDAGCDGASNCVACVDSCPASTNECRRATCTGGVCGFENVPAGTLCNNSNDQCDGNGNCVDCVNSGGCGECCVCQNKVCIPS